MFLSTGEIDTNRTLIKDLNFANTLLADSILLVRSFASQEIDFWKLINWFVVSFYWLSLYELGQIEPTTYTPQTLIDVGVCIPDFTQPTFYSPTNNIFVNNTLFQIYSEYFRTTIFPIFNFSAPEFLQLNETNRLQPRDITFIRGYNCQERNLKSGWYFSVFAVDFAFITGAYHLLIFIIGIMEKRRRKGVF